MEALSTPKEPGVSSAPGSPFSPNLQPGQLGFAQNLAKGITMLEKKRKEMEKLKTFIKGKKKGISRLNSQARPGKKREVADLKADLREMEDELEVLCQGVGAIRERYLHTDRFARKKEREHAWERRGAVEGVISLSSAESVDSIGWRDTDATLSGLSGTPGLLREIRVAESPTYIRADKMAFTKKDVDDIDPTEKRWDAKIREESQSGTGAPSSSPRRKPSFHLYRSQEESRCRRRQRMMVRQEECPKSPGKDPSGCEEQQARQLESLQEAEGLCAGPAASEEPGDVPRDALGDMAGKVVTDQNAMETDVNIGAAEPSLPDIAVGDVSVGEGAGQAGRIGQGGPPRRSRVYPADPGRHRNAVRLRWVGEGSPPDTRTVMDRILDMGFTAEDLNCFVHNAVFRDYSVSFLRPQDLDKFWASFKQLELVGGFAGFEAVAVSRPSVVKVNIILENESIPPSDLKVWLGRYGKVVEELEMDFGYRGVWMGGWWAKMRLKVVGHVTQHIPNSAYIGRDLVCCSYPGQPRECWKCGSTRHLSISCDVLKCAMCLDVGHVTKTCPKSIRCNLCGELGHAYGSCPSSWHKIDEEFRAQGDDARVEDIDGSVEVVEETQLSSESESEGGGKVPELVASAPLLFTPVSLLSTPVPLLSPPPISFPGQDPARVPQRGSGGGIQRGRPMPQGRGRPQGLSRSGLSRSEVNKEKVVGKPGSFPSSSRVAKSKSKSKEKVGKGERGPKVPPDDCVRVEKKGNLDPSKGEEAYRRRETASAVGTSNRYGPLSWGERVEMEEGDQAEIQEEPGHLGVDDVDSCAPVSSESEFEEIDPIAAEGMPSGMSAKRECSEDDRRTKRRAEAAAS
ncbi:hypothetical protein XELAEV_18034024mg [Xenopus laevis]|uniref:CCHC-type domain-containing protein n=1 Tax=Xenopus laevis TaxID=8355 RepID=A0A974CLX5_XENLA|nr:hypothetical protein XELAEV_18034024mg [Xenopus laevis]